MLGLGAALSTVRGGWRRRELLQSGVLSPLMVPRIVTGVAIFIAAVTVGLYPSHASIILAHVVLLMPYVTSLLVAALAQVNLVEEEAARDLGAGPLRTFWLATMPQIRGSMLVAAVFAFIVSFDEFDISFFLARSKNMTLPVRMFLFMQEQENPTMAAMSSMLIGIMVLIVVAAVFLSRRTDLVSIFARRKV